MTAEELVKEIDALASLPDIAIKINDLLQDASSSAWDIGNVIEQDPGLSAALLRIANSAVYNSGVPVTAIDRAVTMVGTREVRDLAFGVCAVAAFDGISNELITMEDFWHHSLRTAAAARTIQKVARLRGGHPLFIAGLLHDIGQLVMFSQRPELSEQALKLSVDQNDGLSTFAAEREIFGFDHTEVGHALAIQWGLPEYVQEAIRYHHDPLADIDIDALKSDPMMTVRAAIHLANCIAVLGEIESINLDDGPLGCEQVLDALSLGVEDIHEIIEVSGQTVDELLGVFVRRAA